MKHVIQTGTDVAVVCFFDPAGLPPDFDERVREGLRIFTELGGKGLFWSKSTGSDGGYLFHFYVDEEIPALIQKHSEDPQNIKRFSVPSGALFACGAEYAARDPAKKLERFGHMGGGAAVPPGDYAVTVWRTEWPEGMEEAELQRRLGRNTARRTQRLGGFTGILFLGTLVASLVAAVETFKTIGEGWRPGLTWLWSGVIAAWAICLPLFRVLSRLERDPRRQEIMMEFPSIVVQMKPIT